MKKKGTFPLVSLILMIVVYFVIGTILICIPHGRPIIWGMDLPSFIMAFGGYLFVIAACIFFVKTNR